MIRIYFIVVGFMVDGDVIVFRFFFSFSFLLFPFFFFDFLYLYILLTTGIRITCIKKWRVCCLSIYNTIHTRYSKFTPETFVFSIERHVSKLFPWVNPKKYIRKRKENNRKFTYTYTYIIWQTKKNRSTYNTSIMLFVFTFQQNIY